MSALRGMGKAPLLGITLFFKSFFFFFMAARDNIL